MSNEIHYPKKITKEIDTLLSQASSLNEQITANKNKDISLWQAITKKLKVNWTYHSNSLEGSALSFGETLFFLNEGLTVEGKPFKDFLDAKNHAEAIDTLYELVANKREFSESVIKELNALLLSGVRYTPAINSQGQQVKKKLTAGEYKTLPNHVLQKDGRIHYYVDPLKVKDQIEELVGWANNSVAQLHPIHVASVVHYNLVRIHAFDDGNGRGARILMNLLLMKQGFFSVVIRTEKKRQYLDTLLAADQGDLMPFIAFISTELIETYKAVIDDLSPLSPLS